MIKFKLTHGAQVIEFASLELAQAYAAEHSLNVEIIEFFEELPVVEEPL